MIKNNTIMIITITMIMKQQPNTQTLIVLNMGNTITTAITKQCLISKVSQTRLKTLSAFKTIRQLTMLTKHYLKNPKYLQKIKETKGDLSIPNELYGT